MSAGILIIEDNQELARNIHDFLASEGYVCELSYTCEAAKEKLTEAQALATAGRFTVRTSVTVRSITRTTTGFALECGAVPASERIEADAVVDRGRRPFDLAGAEVADLEDVLGVGRRLPLHARRKQVDEEVIA